MSVSLIYILICTKQIIKEPYILGKAVVARLTTKGYNYLKPKIYTFMICSQLATINLRIHKDFW